MTVSAGTVTDEVRAARRFGSFRRSVSFSLALPPTLAAQSRGWPAMGYGGRNGKSGRAGGLGRAAVQSGRGRGTGGHKGRARGARDDEDENWNEDRSSNGFRESGEKTHPTVKFNDYLLAREVRPFPGPDGTAFVKRRGSKGDAESLGLKKIAGNLTYLTSEWLNGRLAHAGSFLGANVEELVKMMTLLGDIPQSPGGMKTGLSPIASALSGEEGAAVIRAAKTLNMQHEDSSRQPAELQRAIVKVFSFLKSVERPTQKLACMSAKLLAFSFSALEITAALSARDHWADQLHSQAELHNADIKAFVREPSSDSKLVKAIVASYLDAFAHREKTHTQRGIFDDDDDDGVHGGAGARREKRKAGRAREPNPYDEGGGELSLGEDSGADTMDERDDGLFGGTQTVEKAPSRVDNLFDPPSELSSRKKRGHAGRAPSPPRASKRGKTIYPQDSSAAKESFRLPSDEESLDEEMQFASLDSAITEWGAESVCAAEGQVKTSWP